MGENVPFREIRVLVGHHPRQPGKCFYCWNIFFEWWLGILEKIKLSDGMSDAARGLCIEFSSVPISYGVRVDVKLQAIVLYLLSLRRVGALNKFPLVPLAMCTGKYSRTISARLLCSSLW